ncbi:hypothetical protein AAHC03_016413 [Spirometra sp. Aus1]
MARVQLTSGGTFVCVIGFITFIMFWSSHNVSELTPTSAVLSVRSLLSASVKAAEVGALAIRMVHSTNRLNIRTKPRLVNSRPEVVTEADIVSHYCILFELRKYYPELVIRSEEHEEPSREMKKLVRSLRTASMSASMDRLPERDMFVQLSDVTVWVDPLDATEELKDGLLDYVSVMICGTVQGNPVLGVVHMVFSNETSWGWMPNDFSHNLQPLPVHSLNVSPLRILISRSHASDELEAAITSAFAPTTVSITRAGGAGYKIMKLLKGEADLYIHPSGARKWDLCAPTVVLEAAGGVVRTMDGRRHQFLRLNPNSTIAEAGGIFAAATQALYDRWALTVRNVHRSLLRSKHST